MGNARPDHGEDSKEDDDDSNDGNNRRMRRTRNEDEEQRVFKCNFCEKSYLSYPALYTHKKTKHKQ